MVDFTSSFERGPAPMSRNPYSNLSHEELLKLLAEKDAQLE